MGELPGLDPREEFSRDELQLAARNPGIPLEALRHDVTPLGLHYLLIHYDIPTVDPETWRLEIGGAVEHELSLSLDDVRARRARTLHVTMECAGNAVEICALPFTREGSHERVRRRIAARSDPVRSCITLRG